MRIISHEWRILSEEIGCFVLDVHDRLTVRLAVEKRGEDYLSVCCLPTQTKIAPAKEMSVTTSGKVSRVALWVLSALLAAVFLMAGIPKLMGVEAHVRHFATWGYPDWFRLVVGTVEVASAVLLLVPGFAFFGATGIAVIMVGATYVIRAPQEAGQAPVTLTFLALAALVAYARRPARITPTPEHQRV
jgi:putative oxidoreductase